MTTVRKIVIDYIEKLINQGLNLETIMQDKFLCRNFSQEKIMKYYEITLEHIQRQNNKKIHMVTLRLPDIIYNKIKEHPTSALRTIINQHFDIQEHIKQRNAKKFIY